MHHGRGENGQVEILIRELSSRTSLVVDKGGKLADASTNKSRGAVKSLHQQLSGVTKRDILDASCENTSCRQLWERKRKVRAESWRFTDEVCGLGKE